MMYPYKYDYSMESVHYSMVETTENEGVMKN